MAKRRNLQDDFMDSIHDIRHHVGVFMNKGMGALYEAGGYHFLGKQFMNITTTGRKSGLPRTTPIGYVETGQFVYALTRGGPQISNWLRNVKSNPKVKLQIRER